MISTEAGLWFIFAGGGVGTPGGRGGGGLAQVGLKEGGRGPHWSFQSPGSEKKGKRYR